MGASTNTIAAFVGEDAVPALVSGLGTAAEAPCNVHSATNKPDANVVHNRFITQTRAHNGEIRGDVLSTEGTEKYRKKAHISL